MEGADAVLEDWWVSNPHPGYYHLVGHIYHDKKGRFADGMHVHTSGISLNQKMIEGSVVHTNNSSYLLGVPARQE